MLRCIAFATTVLLAALLPAGSAIAAPSNATGTIEVVSAEMAFEIGNVDEINVVGSGRCASAGTVLITVRITDLETGGSATGNSQTTCRYAGERIRWSTLIVSFATVRGGDRVVVEATATGAINDSDAKIVTLHWQT